MNPDDVQPVAHDNPTPQPVAPPPYMPPLAGVQQSAPAPTMQLQADDLSNSSDSGKAEPLIPYWGLATIAVIIIGAFSLAGWTYYQIQVSSRANNSGVPDSYYGTTSQPVETPEQIPANNSSPSVTFDPDVTIGSQTWMKNNLDVGSFVDAGIVQTNNNVTEKHCYLSDQINCDTYGGLYSWDEAMRYSTAEGSQGICPSTFHIPTDAEWAVLKDYLGTTTEMKLGGSSGFDARFAGVISDDHDSKQLGVDGYFWSSTQYNVSTSWAYSLHSYTINLDNSNVNKNHEFSVRCIKD